MLEITQTRKNEKALAARVSAEEYKTAQKLADKYNTTISELIRALIKQEAQAQS